MKRKLLFCIIAIVVFCAVFGLTAPRVRIAPQSAFGMPARFLQKSVSMSFDACTFENLKFMESNQVILKESSYKGNTALIAIFILCGLWLCVLDFLARISKKRRYLTSSVTSSPFGGHSPPVSLPAYAFLHA